MVKYVSDSTAWHVVILNAGYNVLPLSIQNIQ